MQGLRPRHIEVSTQRVDKRLFNRHRSPARSIILRVSHSRCDLRKRQAASAMSKYPPIARRQSKKVPASSYTPPCQSRFSQIDTIRTSARAYSMYNRGRTFGPPPAVMCVAQICRASACDASRDVGSAAAFAEARPYSSRTPRSCPRTSTTVRCSSSPLPRQDVGGDTVEEPWSWRPTTALCRERQRAFQRAEGSTSRSFARRGGVLPPCLRVRARFGRLRSPPERHRDGFLLIGPFGQRRRYRPTGILMLPTWNGSRPSETTSHTVFRVNAGASGQRS